MARKNRRQVTEAEDRNTVRLEGTDRGGCWTSSLTDGLIEKHGADFTPLLEQTSGPLGKPGMALGKL